MFYLPICLCFLVLNFVLLVSPTYLPSELILPFVLSSQKHFCTSSASPLVCFSSFQVAFQLSCLSFVFIQCHSTTYNSWEMSITELAVFNTVLTHLEWKASLGVFTLWHKTTKRPIPSYKHTPLSFSFVISCVFYSQIAFVAWNKHDSVVRL